MKISPWRKVATAVNAGSGLSGSAFVAAARIPTMIRVAISATRKPTPAYHAGQRGALPSGSSGRSGGGGGGGSEAAGRHNVRGGRGGLGVSAFAPPTGAAPPPPAAAT